MTIYVLATIEDPSVLPDLIGTYVEKSIKFTVSKDVRSLCSDCTVAPQKPSTSCCSSSNSSSAVFDQMPSPDRSGAPSACCNPKVSCDPLYANISELSGPEELKLMKEEEEDDDDDGTLEGGQSALDIMGEDEEDNLTYQSSSYMEEDMELGVVCSKRRRPVYRQYSYGQTKGSSRQCQMCEVWITAKNIRAHAGTHINLCRLKCSLCDKTFARMNRGVIHLKSHPADSGAKIISAVTEDQQRQLDDLMLKCFPPMCYCRDKCMCKC